MIRPRGVNGQLSRRIMKYYRELGDERHPRVTVVWQGSTSMELDVPWFPLSTSDGRRPGRTYCNYNSCHSANDPVSPPYSGAGKGED